MPATRRHIQGRRREHRLHVRGLRRGRPHHRIRQLLHLAVVVVLLPGSEEIDAARAWPSSPLRRRSHLLPLLHFVVGHRGDDTRSKKRYSGRTSLVQF